MARTEGLWKKPGSYISPTEDVPIVLENDYLNFGGLISGDIGYGIRNEGGVIQIKNFNGTWTNALGGGGGHTIEDEGTPLTQRTKLNFVGVGVTVTDDAGDDATVVTIPTGGAVDSVNTRTGAVTGLAENSDLTAHVDNVANPHSVTKAQVGLSNVPNTDFTAAVDANTDKISFDSTSSTRLANTSGTNTGDNATNTQYSGLAASKQDTITVGTTAPGSPTIGQLWVDTN